ncbi:MAG: hypothetical protein AAF657_19615 [Acidobacteriota bacterium]
MRAVQLSAWVFVAYLASGCSALSFHRDELRETDSAVDVEALEEYLASHPFGGKSDTRRFQLAMAYLDAETEAHDPAQARSHLWQLQSSAASPYKEVSGQLLVLLKEVDHLRGAAVFEARRLEQVRAEVSHWRGAVEVAQSRLDEQGASASQLQVELQAAHGKLRRLGEESASQKQEIERLTRELRELKRIDTRQAP